MSLSPDQAEAVEFVTGGVGAFFLTGQAGSGKSYVINHLRATHPKCLVTAMTGAAASLIGGQTAHRVLGIHPRGIQNSPDADARVRECQLLIIDEISMASAHFYGQILRRFESAGRSPKLLMVGDFYQLPPVRKKTDPSLKGVKIFATDEWKEVQTLYLSQQHRQIDNRFITVLNDIRTGTFTNEHRSYLNRRRVDVLPRDCVHLHPRKATVDETNMARLNEIDEPEMRFFRAVAAANPKKPNPSLEYLDDCRFLDIVRLKTGARIVMLTNDREGRWVNGSTGVVLEISYDYIDVLFDRGARRVKIQKETIEVCDENNEPVFKVTQMPLMLAWAFTIHKAQGMTMDRVGVNLDGHFASGQTYVSLSRCRSYEGLFITGSFGNIRVDPDVAEYEITGRVANPVTVFTPRNERQFFDNENEEEQFLTRAELLAIKSRVAACRTLAISMTLVEMETLIADYEEAIKLGCDAVNASAMDDRVHSNIEWQRNWCSRQLAELGVNIPHPEYPDEGMIERSEARVRRIAMLIEQSEKSKEPS